MCGFVGFTNFKAGITKDRTILENMNKTLAKRGPDEEGYYIDKNVALAHRRLIVIDPEGGKQPMIEKYSFGTYVIVYNGQIYNTKELKKVLLEHNFKINTHSDTEILLKSYIYYGKDVINHLNGIFASEIKALFKYPGIEKILDKQGISELFGIGPAHTPRNYCF